MEKQKMDPLTIGECVMKVFPAGTLPFEGGSLLDGSKKLDPSWATPPASPFDLFAICGYLMSVSGLVGFFEPDPDVGSIVGSKHPLKVTLSLPERLFCEEVGSQWFKNGDKVPSDIDTLWEDLAKAWNQPVRGSIYQSKHRHSDTNGGCPKWWNAVVKLFIISDEASKDVGYLYSESISDIPKVHFRIMTALRESRAKDIKPSDDPNMLYSGRPLGSYAEAAMKEVICVQPKGRVSQLGHSLRNFSKNLSLIGPVGQARCKWHQLAAKSKVDEDQGLDILLVPFPFEIPAKSFKSLGNDASKKDKNGLNPGWGNFKIDQSWLENTDAIIEMVSGLIKEAKKDTETINAVIFPEYSLNYEIFNLLCEEIVKIEPSIEFVIAGSSNNCLDEEGNCVLTAIWETSVGNNESDYSEKKTRRVTSQRKHHRWRLDKSQLNTYGLSGRLQPSKNWWENHSVGQRELNFYQFRKSSTFASLICEDLARNDPVHDIVRSVAPNLLFALLMDGSQLPYRWSARYASTLADDPGTSVLTFTSYGLLKRANENALNSQSHAVGFWKDESGASHEVILPPSAKGVLLSLSAFRTSDFTIDGRKCEGARSWRFNSQKPLFL